MGNTTISQKIKQLDFGKQKEYNNFRGEIYESYKTRIFRKFN